jgi:pimeloyl-ACP methyl ester carboxylesterase
MTFVPHHRIVKGAAAAGGAGRLSFVLHGALGSGQNFSRFVGKLAEERPDHTYVLVDLRHHGDSRGAPGPNTLEACAKDLALLSDSLGRQPDVLIGHSFGGKVALEYARVVAGPLAQAWILDAVPGAQAAVDETEIVAVIRAVRAVPVPARSRRDVIDHLTGQAGLSSGLAEWMATNLRRQGEQYVWTFDLDAIEQLMTDYFSVDLWGFLAQKRETPELHLVVAERSSRWTPEQRQRAQALPPETRVTYHELPNSGHWVHVDNPGGLLEIIAPRLVR